MHSRDENETTISLFTDSWEDVPQNRPYRPVKSNKILNGGIGPAVNNSGCQLYILVYIYILCIVHSGVPTVCAE